MHTKTLPAIVQVTACICIMLIECMAIYKGIDGTYLALSMSVISGIAGYSIKRIVRR